MPDLTPHPTARPSRRLSALWPARCVMLVWLVAAVIALASPLAHADFAEGRAAFERGDFTTAYAIAKREAERGDAEAQGYLGILYYYGKGGAKHDHKTAAMWYRLAADQDHHPAQLNLGVMYANGEGVQHDMVEAYKWFTLAARGKGPVAQQNQALAKRKLTKAQLKDANRRIAEWEKAHGK